MAQKPVKVSQINAYIKRVLQSDPLLSNVSVTGEISNLKYHGTGNIYFTLKDESSKLNCFLGSEYLKNVPCDLSDGMQIIASGSIYLYERGGYYSLNVRDVAIEGEGSLFAAFAKLREKLEKEGLFDDSHKKRIPPFPGRIAVVTSQTGAAVRDIITTIKNRNSYADIFVFPCLVQGAGAAADIAETIDMVNRDYPDMDVMIVGRGGGSSEELWAFNEEIVARSIYGSSIPVISAVGHETDFTIADFTADLRAATPTAAAQAAVPDTLQLRMYLDELAQGCRKTLDQKIMLCSMTMDKYNFDSLKNTLAHRIEISRIKADSIIQSISHASNMMAVGYESRIEACKTALETLDPGNILRRGYSIVQDRDGRFITSAAMAAPRDLVRILLKDGTMDCDIKKITMEERKDAGRQS